MNPLYRSAVSELEGVLSPRVVSRSLREGMAQAGTNPEDLTLEQLEKILKGPVYQHLQVTMQVERARTTVEEILERLAQVGGPSAPRNPTPPPLDSQAEAIANLTDAMRPYNLYFEWPEVQKLRTQLRLLEEEQKQGKQASELLSQAKEQLRLVGEKLEDLLVMQARDLGELESLLEGLGEDTGTRVRRLENLLGHIREAQEGRQLATAEIERARKLATKLRKELEAEAIDNERARLEEGRTHLFSAEADSEMNERLLSIDLESERVELGAIAKGFAQVIEYRPALRERIDAMHRQLEAKDTLGEELNDLRRELEAAGNDLRSELEAELTQMRSEAEALSGSPEGEELVRAIDVASGMLQNSLPSHDDVSHIRDLHALARAGGEGGAGNGEVVVDGREVVLSRRLEELGELRTLESEASRFAGSGEPGYERLRELLDEAQLAPQGDRLDDLLGLAWLQLDTLRSSIEQRLSGVEGRLDEAKAKLERVEKLNSDGVAEARRILRHLDGQRTSLDRVSLGLRLELEGSLRHAEKLLAELEQELEATQAIAGTLVSGNFIDDMLGLLDPSDHRETEEPGLGMPDVVHAFEPTLVRSGDNGIDAWIDDLLSREGVSAAALFDEAGDIRAGKLPVEPSLAGTQLGELLSQLTRLGNELALGKSGLVTVETGRGAVIVGQHSARYRFLALLDGPQTLGSTLHELRNRAVANAG